MNRLNKIVSQFLDYARPYRGEQRQLEVAEVLRKTLALFAKEAEEHGKVEIATDFADKMPPVRADAEQLLQVFLNLSLNALQAMPNGGKLWISTALRRSTRRGAAAAFLEVRFRDAGVGIPAGDLKNLFIPFFTTKEKGTGLGLPDQPAHHREPRRHHRGALAAGRGRDVHGAAADRGRRLRRLFSGNRPRRRGCAGRRGRPPAAPAADAAAAAARPPATSRARPRAGPGPPPDAGRRRTR